MRTTLDIPHELMDEALRMSQFRSKTDVVIYSLKELIRRKRLEELKELKGKLNIEIDLAKSRKRTR